MQRSSSRLKQLWISTAEPLNSIHVCRHHFLALADTKPVNFNMSQCAEIRNRETIRPCVMPTCQTVKVSEVIYSCMDKLFLNLMIPTHCVIAPQNHLASIVMSKLAFLFWIILNFESCWFESFCRIPFNILESRLVARIPVELGSTEESRLVWEKYRILIFARPCEEKRTRTKAVRNQFLFALLNPVSLRRWKSSFGCWVERDLVFW